MPLSTIAPPPEPPTVFGRFLPRRIKRVARLPRVSFSPERYEDSYVRFLSTPPLTVYMPAEGPARFPDSVFSRILRVLSAGGHRFYDVTNPPPPPDSYERPPRAANGGGWHHAVVRGELPAVRRDGLRPPWERPG